MKQKYTKYIAGLLIGLFSLSTLSSCVDTRQTLGAHGSYTVNEEWGNDNNENLLSEDQNNTKKNNSCTCKQMLGAGLLGFIILLSAAGGITYSLNNNTEPTNRNSNNTITTVDYRVNHTNSNRPNNSSSNSPEANELINFLNHSKDYKLKFKNAPFNKTWLHNDTPESTVFQLPKLERFQGMTVHELVHKISQDNFNLDTLQKWLNKGLNPNIANRDGTTLMMKLAKNSWGIPEDKQWDIMTILLNTGKINLDQTNNGGLTVPDYLLSSSIEAKLREYKPKEQGKQHKKKTSRIKNK
ncbi:hypothetical protein [Cardinium endosymbiont of Sogatella furcifera]|uniref:hypothetical protein n=1 Tax=Cardinium endosymbiont of Sogatella furcifera TaxID=650378 RepID=UPI0013B4380F|nr:hypothetical protein [Cardinium endosymbiont of Sogatella furcifera]